MDEADEMAPARTHPSTLRAVHVGKARSDSFCVSAPRKRGGEPGLRFARRTQPTPPLLPIIDGLRPRRRGRGRIAMNPQAAQNYLRTRVMTATPEQLQMMLYDGAIRFAEQAKAALVTEDYEKSYQSIAKVQKILTEMSCGLKPDVLPELCDKLSALYSY